MGVLVIAALRACVRRLLAALDPLATWAFADEPEAFALPAHRSFDSMRDASVLHLAAVIADATKPRLVELCACCGDDAAEGESFATHRCPCTAHAWRGLMCESCAAWVPGRVPRPLRFPASACAAVRCEGGEA